jgi:hypothetical protein
MDSTTLNMPVSAGSLINRAILRLIGWKLVGKRPEHARYVMVGAPHTSNLDFFLFLLLIGGFDVKAYWIGKDSLFRGLLGKILTSLRGIPVNRRSSNGFVQQMTDVFVQHKEIVIAIAPEGTRQLTKLWKTGFYYIALSAQVPIAMGFLDSRRKEVGFGPTLMPTGNIEADFEIIREFYQEKVGLNPAQQGMVKIKDTP